MPAIMKAMGIHFLKYGFLLPFTIQVTPMSRTKNVAAYMKFTRMLYLLAISAGRIGGLRRSLSSGRALRGPVGLQSVLRGPRCHCRDAVSRIGGPEYCSGDLTWLGLKSGGQLS
jgi:hypothetical protein